MKCEKCGKKVSKGETQTYYEEEICKDCYGKEMRKQAKEIDEKRTLALGIDDLKKEIESRGKRLKLSNKQIEQTKKRAQNFKTWQLMRYVLIFIVVIFLYFGVGGLLEAFVGLLMLIFFTYAYIKKRRFISYLRKLKFFNF